MEIFTKAFSKINIALDVQGITENGYHLLDTIICPINIYDELYLEKRQDSISSITFANCPHIENDNVLRLLRLLEDRYKISGYNITVTKNIPLSSGLGGSSADAAYAARAIEQLENIKIDPSILNQVGSDVYAMYLNTATRLRGVGNIVEKITLPKLYVAILYSNNPVNSKDSFNLYDKIGGDHINIDEFVTHLHNPVNSLQRASTLLCSDISFKSELLSLVGYNAVMSGSGSAVIGYETDKDNFIKKQEILHGLLKGHSNIQYLYAETL